MDRGILENKKRPAMFIMIIALIALFLVLICVGRYPISPFRAFEIIGRSFVGKTDGMDVYESSVILSIRLPRILMGILVGAGLSVSGAIYQAVFGNPLVSPDILGVSSGAGFGAALAILLSCGMAATQVTALGCGLLAVVVVLNLSRIKRRSELFVLVLSGVIVKSMFDALVSFIKYIADPEDKLPTITMWLMGSLANVSYRDVLLCAAIEIPCLAVAMILEDEPAFTGTGGSQIFRNQRQKASSRRDPDRDDHDCGHRVRLRHYRMDRAGDSPYCATSDRK